MYFIEYIKGALKLQYVYYYRCHRERTRRNSDSSQSFFCRIHNIAHGQRWAFILRVQTCVFVYTVRRAIRYTASKYLIIIKRKKKKTLLAFNSTRNCSKERKKGRRRRRRIVILPPLERTFWVMWVCTNTHTVVCVF